MKIQTSEDRNIKTMLHCFAAPVRLCFILLTAYCLLLTNANAFNATGCEGDCKKCHSLNNQEVGAILKKVNLSHAKILSVQLSPVKSLWEIAIDDKGKRGVFYVDFSKKYLLPGPIIEVSTGSNRTVESLQKIPIGKTDFSRIPLKNDLLVGSANAATKVVIFTDPD